MGDFHGVHRNESSPTSSIVPSCFLPVVVCCWLLSFRTGFILYFLGCQNVDLFIFYMTQHCGIAIIIVIIIIVAAPLQCHTDPERCGMPHAKWSALLQKYATAFCPPTSPAPLRKPRPFSSPNSHAPFVA